MTTHDTILTPVARLPQGSPDSWQGFPRWLWVRTPQGYTAACARLRLSAHRRAVLDAITARLWGPQGGRRDRPGKEGDEVQGARWTVRELAAALTSAVGYAIHRTDIHRAVSWLLSHAVIARSTATEHDTSFRYLVRPYEHWTRAATVKPGDPGYPLALRDRRRLAREAAEKLAEQVEADTGPLPGVAASQGPQGLFVEPTVPPVSAPVLAPFICGPTPPVLSTLPGDDRAESTRGSETPSNQPQFFNRAGAVDCGPVTGSARALPVRASRWERAGSWYVVVSLAGGKAQRVPLWDAVRRLAGDGWAAIRDRGPLAHEANAIADALAACTSQSWAPSAVLDALRLAVTRDHEAEALAEAEETVRIRGLADAAALAGREALRTLPPVPDRDPGLAAAALALAKALDRLTAGHGSGEGELLAVIADDRREEVERQHGRHLAREMQAARERAAVEQLEAARLRTEQGRTEQGRLAVVFDELIKWARTVPARAVSGRWGDVLEKAHARERDADAVLLWRLRGGHCSPAEVAKARERVGSLEARRGRPGRPGARDTASSSASCPGRDTSGRA